MKNSAGDLSNMLYSQLSAANDKIAGITDYKKKVYVVSYLA